MPALRQLALVSVALSVACFAPKVKNKGFACNGSVDSCPAGFACLNGLCDDGSGGSPPAPVADMAMGGTGGDDLAQAMSSPDLAQAMSSPDLAQAAPPDLAPACVPTGGDCTYHKDSVCCSLYCVYATNKCR